MNLVDAVILLITAYYIWRGLAEGFWRLAIEGASFVIAIVLALLTYPRVAAWLTRVTGLGGDLARPIAYTVIWIAVEATLFLTVSRFLPRLKDTLPKRTDRLLSIIPSLVKAVIVATIVLSVAIALPISGIPRDQILHSKLGAPLLTLSTKLDQTFEKIYGGVAADALNFFTIEPQSDESLKLGYTVADPQPDPAAEAKMLGLVNAERQKRGLTPLTIDPKLTAVARAHSADMWKRGYFAHVDPDGNDPCQRVSAGGVSYTFCGENLALAPDVAIAHDGLMQSPGHRANILDPRYRHIGIGVMGGGVHGEMFTQDFTD